MHVFAVQKFAKTDFDSKNKRFSFFVMDTFLCEKSEAKPEVCKSVCLSSMKKPFISVKALRWMNTSGKSIYNTKNWSDSGKYQCSLVEFWHKLQKVRKDGETSRWYL